MAKRPFYKWFYDHVHSHDYDIVMRWVLWPFGGEEHFRREMMTSVDLTGARRVLDLCCGTGSSSRAIRSRADASAQVLGADLSLGQLRQAKRKRDLADVPLVEADATQIPFAAGCFDAVVIPHALHEMPRATRIAALRDARRVLRRAGRVFVLDLDDPPSLLLRLLLGLWLGYWLPYPLNFENPTRRDMVRHGLLNELTQAGFGDAEKISKFRGTMQVVTARP